MKITLEKHGGLAGLKLPPKVVDTQDLPPEQAAELEKLATAAKADGSVPASERLRDAITYRVTIEDGGQSATLSQSDGGLTPAFSALLARLNR